jgi:hypothetical protein
MMFAPGAETLNYYALTITSPAADAREFLSCTHPHHDAQKVKCAAHSAGPKLPPQQPMHPAIRNVARHVAILAQNRFADKPARLRHAG